MYKTPEQWLEENPGFAETLTWRSLSYDEIKADGTNEYYLNERIKWVIPLNSNPIPFIPVSIGTSWIEDRLTGDMLVKQTTVGGGYGSFGVGGSGSWKIWVNPDSCVPSGKEYGKYLSRYKKLGSEQ